jgi:N-acetylglucosamine kinase-like BadF-type ATPase
VSGPPAAVLAVDGGNSKTDLALVAADGRLLAAARGPTISHQQVGWDGQRTGFAEQLATLRRTAGLAADAKAGVAVFCLAGADFPRETRRIHRTMSSLGVARETVILNDSFAPLRAGTRQRWGVAVICGAGVNAAGIAPDGRTARFAALGEISGDWGGGTSVGMAGLGAAVRARDGRGPRTTLEQLVPAHFGLRSPAAVTEALYDHRIEVDRVRELSPIVFDAATAGDAAAREVVDRLAAEIATMAVAIARRLGLLRRDVEVVLAGGVFRATDAGFYRAIERGVTTSAPRARFVRLDAPPVAGAALLGLDRLAAGPSQPVADRLRRALKSWDRAVARAPR